uniref:TTF-type domain-containing protein n=1 Tax=Amphimedon queenslandica TaxID=400682 RepID=A0A1X7SIG2_AMPQE
MSRQLSLFSYLKKPSQSDHIGNSSKRRKGLSDIATSNLDRNENEYDEENCNESQAAGSLPDHPYESISDTVSNLLPVTLSDNNGSYGTSPNLERNENDDDSMTEENQSQSASFRPDHPISDTIASDLSVTLNVSSTSLGTSASAVSSSVSVSDIASTSSSTPCQPHINFPVTIFSGKGRSFNPDWYNKFKWLEYSVSKDAAFCFPCRFFFSPSSTSNRPEKAFTEVGFRNWKNAIGKTSGVLTKHNECYSHKQSVIAWEQFVYAEKHSNIVEQLGVARDQQIKKNRHY